MQRHFHEEIRALKQKLLEMSFMVEEQVAHACDALLERNGELAREVMDHEKEVNALEIEIDDKGHSLFALGQPMASDLRLITMILKINTDLERMGDHAVNIAEKSLYIIPEPSVPVDEPLGKMASAVQKMLRNSLDAFLKEDAELAMSVLKHDDEVDNDNVRIYERLNAIMEKDSAAVTAGINLLMVSHNLERIADLACNIAEDVIYLKQGQEVRHRIQMGGNPA